MMMMMMVMMVMMTTVVMTMVMMMMMAIVRQLKLVALVEGECRCFREKTTVLASPP